MIFFCYYRERVRAKDIRVEDRVFLVTPEPPEGHMNRTKTQMNLGPRGNFTSQRAVTVI